jgi:hypothetical protein
VRRSHLTGNVLAAEVVQRRLRADRRPLVHWPYRAAIYGVLVDDACTSEWIVKPGAPPWAIRTPCNQLRRSSKA